MQVEHGDEKANMLACFGTLGTLTVPGNFVLVLGGKFWTEEKAPMQIWWTVHGGNLSTIIVWYE